MDRWTFETIGSFLLDIATFTWIILGGWLIMLCMIACGAAAALFIAALALLF